MRRTNKKSLGDASQNFTQGGNQAQTFLLIILVFVVIFFLLANFRDIFKTLFNGQKNETGGGGNSINTNTAQLNPSTSTTPTAPSGGGTGGSSFNEFPIQRGSSNAQVERYQRYLFSLADRAGSRAYYDNWFSSKGDSMGTWGAATNDFATWNGKPKVFNSKAELDRVIGTSLGSLKKEAVYIR